MYTTSQRLADVIKAIISAELLNEKKRLALAAQPFFEVTTAFKRLDQRRLSSLDMNDLIEFLNDNKVVATSAEQVYLFKNIDRDRDGRISLRDFEKFTYTKYSQVKAPYEIDVGMLLPTEVEYALADLFTSVILSYRSVLSSKNALVSSLDYSSLEAFRNLDLFNVGYSTKDTLAIYMKSQGYYLTNDEIDAFFRAVDLDEDGRISYTELVEAVHLAEPLPYSAAVRELELQKQDKLYQIIYKSALDRSRSLQTVYLSQYPYYFSPYYPTLYPSYYPYLSRVALRSSVERINVERRASEERLRQSELRLAQEDARNRLENQLQAEKRQRELDQIRTDELRRSRERVQDLAYESRLRQIELDAAQRDRDRQARFLELEAQNQARQRERERELSDSQIRLQELERLSSLERVRYLDDLRRLEGDVVLSRYRPYYERYYPSLYSSQQGY